MRAFFALVFLALFTVGAAAQSCGALKSQLAAAEAGSPNAAVVARIERKSRSYGCDKPAGRGRSSACAGIDAQLRQAKAGGVNRSRVRRLRSQIDTHCTEQKSWTEALRVGPRRESKGNRRGNFITRLFGRNGDDSEGFAEAEVDPRTVQPAKGVERVDLDTGRASGGGSGSSGGNYAALATRSGGAKGSSRTGNQRTMCVRLCDGFYFPINNHSHSDNYYDELAMCVGRCPGADVSLYVHSNGVAVEQMRSTMTGEAYVHLPTAFAYRKTLSPSCSCSNGTQLVRGGEEAPKVALASAASTDGGFSDTKDESRWTPFRAIYDSTGAPLSASTTSHGTVFSERPSANSGALAANLSGPPAPPDAAEGTPFDPASNAARPVGPQFFTKNVAEFAARKGNRLSRRGQVVAAPIIITVTPLKDRDDPAAGRQPEAPAPAAPAVQAEADADAEEIPPGTAALAKPLQTGSGG